MVDKEALEFCKRVTETDLFVCWPKPVGRSKLMICHLIGTDFYWYTNRPAGYSGQDGTRHFWRYNPSGISSAARINPEPGVRGGEVSFEEVLESVPKEIQTKLLFHLDLFA